MTIQEFIRSVFFTVFSQLSDDEWNNAISLSALMEGPVGLHETVQNLADEFASCHYNKVDVPALEIFGDEEIKTHKFFYQQAEEILKNN